MVRSVNRSRPRRTSRRTSRSGSEASSTLPPATECSGTQRPGPVPHRDEVGAVGLGDGEQLVAVEHAEARGLARGAGEPVELGHRDRPQVERPLGALGEPDDDEAEPVLAALLVLFDEAALLERRQQPRRRGLVQAETARQLRHAGLPVAVPQGQQQGRGPVDRPDGVPVERHAMRPSRWVRCLIRSPDCGVSRPPGGTSRPRAPGVSSPWARASSAASSDAPKIEMTRSTVSPWACASHTNHGSRLSGSGIAPRALHPDRDRVVQLVVGVGPVAVLGGDVVREHDPEHRRVPGDVVGEALRVEQLPDALPGSARRWRGWSRARRCRAGSRAS